VFYRRYHAVVSKDAGARVSRWAQLSRDAPPVAGLPPPAPGDLTRSVFFVKRMELPAAITRLLGAAGGALRKRAPLQRGGRYSRRLRCSAEARAPRAGDVSALEVEEVQRLRAPGGRASGCEIFSAPIVKMKVWLRRSSPALPLQRLTPARALPRAGPGQVHDVAGDARGGAAGRGRRAAHALPRRSLRLRRAAYVPGPI
jgi:hypothetical protein